MDIKGLFRYIDSLRVKPGRKVDLSKWNTDYDHKMVTREEGAQLLEEGVKRLAQMQDMLYAHNQYSMLIVFQAMDAAGKDSAIKHIMSGLNPQGVKVTSYKTPSSTELDHGYLWRHYTQIPARGRSAFSTAPIMRMYWSPGSTRNTSWQRITRISTR